MPERIPLYLPSTFPAEKRSSICVASLPEIEDRLRFAQAHEALTKLRCQLMKRTCANRYKARNVSSQHHYTRFRTLQHHVESKIKAASRQYRTARVALLNLRGPGIWEQTLQEVHPSDVRGLSEKALIDEELEEAKKMRKMAGSRKDPIAGGWSSVSSWRWLQNVVVDLVFDCPRPRPIETGVGVATLSRAQSPVIEDLLTSAPSNSEVAVSMCFEADVFSRKHWHLRLAHLQKVNITGMLPSFSGLNRA